MATLTLDPTAIGHFNEWTLGAGSSKVDAVDDGATADGDTTFINSSATSGMRQSFHVPYVYDASIQGGLVCL